MSFPSMEAMSLSGGTSDSPVLAIPHLRRGPFSRKPISIVLREEQEVDLHINSDSATPASTPGTATGHRRHLSLFDLIAVGVGGTIGSGIFVLTGLIAHHYAGPSTYLSFILSGFAASCSGLCYAEWAGRLPAAGSTYVYAFVSLGEWAAVLSGACLTLEYGVSGAAVARSWGDKVVEWLATEWQWEAAGSYLTYGQFFNPLAGIISAFSVIVLACGVQESKTVTNAFTILKVALVVFMIVGGFYYFQFSNMTPLAPFGVAGILRGATSSFFGYLGYDEVCCLASEAKNPADMPRAVLWTLAIVTSLYVLASIALVGMVPYDQISDTSGFPAAFATRNVGWAAQLTAAGEVFTLPVVVLISLLAQPRLFAAMARDSLMPKIFGQVDRNGNLFWSNILSGIPMTILATVVPFSWLDDAISVGILIAFNMTNSSLILMKCETTSSTSLSRSLPLKLVIYHIISFATGLASHIPSSTWVHVGLVMANLGYAYYVHRTSPLTGTFGASNLYRHDSNPDCALHDNNQAATSTVAFQTPYVPMLPLLGIAANWYLISQLESTGMLLLLLYLGFVSAIYFICSSTSRLSWNIADGDVPRTSKNIRRYTDDIRHNEQPILLREFSLPKRSSG